MTDAPTPEDAAAGAAPTIEQGTYEVIRARLQAHGRELAQRAESLNAARVEIFGGTRMSVVGNERVRTENNCVPRDIVAVDGHLLFGYNVFVGLRTETKIADVFSLQRFVREGESFSFSPIAEGDAADLLADARFQKDFRELHQYYKASRLQALREVDGKLLAIFQTGSNASDTKGLRWAIGADGSVTYVDNQGERDNRYPPSHDFEWHETGRDDHVSGRFPHVSILDEVFVETVGGDLTVKVEDNTEDGLGIYREPVEDADQSLDDASVHYAKLGSLILLRIKPFREDAWRYLVFNTLTKRVDRIDAIGAACVQLPEDHGIIFPGGYYLQRGETKTYEAEIDGMRFDRVVRSPNGEDVLYAFHRVVDGVYVLLPYNLIRKEVDTPLFCQGYCLFDDGRMIVVKGDSEAGRVHAMQIWQTPFVSDVHHAQRPSGGTHLEKLGNADLVRGISDCLAVRRLIDEQSPSRAMYEELIGATRRVLDHYHWLADAPVGDLRTPLRDVLQTAELVVDEFEKVEALRGVAAAGVGDAEARVDALDKSLQPEFWKTVDEFVEALAALRQERGRLISLREVRYVDLQTIDSLEERVVAGSDAVSAKAVEFLAGEGALAPYHARIDDVVGRIDAVEKVADSAPLVETLASIGSGLDLLTEVVGGLDIDDATVRTGILESIGGAMAALNRSRALVVARRQELGRKEGVAEFAAQFALFSQSVSGALALAETPDKCDEQLSRLLVQLEELEGRFGEFDEFLEQLTTKREEVVEALGAKKQTLLDQRQRRAQQLMQSVERILSGVARRASTLKELDDLNAYFVSDPMIMKVRDIARRLRDLDDSVRADEVESNLKSARESAVRQLRDRRDIYEDGDKVIRLGKHRFSVNTQRLDLTIVPHRVGDLDGVALHLTGTDFREPVEDAEFEATREFWPQELVSETPDVYRAEYVAYTLLAAAERAEDGLSLARLAEAAVDADALLVLVRAAATERYDEGYERGVHDHDAALILGRVVAMYRAAGLLRFAPGPRAAACLAWAFGGEDLAEERRRLRRRAQSLQRLRRAFAHSDAIQALESDLALHVTAVHQREGLSLTAGDARVAGRYLFEQLGAGEERFVAGGAAAALREAFLAHLDGSATRMELEEDLQRLTGDLSEQHSLVTAWMTAFVDCAPGGSVPAGARAVLPEAVASILIGDALAQDVQTAQAVTVVEGLLGQHPRIRDRAMEVRLDEFLGRLSRHAHERVPGYRNYQRLRAELLDRQRHRLRISEYLPRVMSSFVRNQLIDEVYLPLIGDNLAKQLGARGASKRTDLMGLLLLISPPGYGKTTLMEYIASRLGLVFMKINGPALGHGVTSLDPAEAPNATARQEVEKVNLALEMGNNVLLYVDDIQHTHPELLQKFISLCDAQRRIEGVWNGRTRTYDMRGKKFVVCMAGNPYTESGERFQVPDMLANRADVYNLGDVLGGKDDLFALSYVENALTSNSVLAQVAVHDHRDIYVFARMARGEDVPATQLKHPYSQVEIEEILSVLRKLLRVQEVLLAVNREYIRSASMDDDFRMEPRFQLQGSYRNMNKLAEKIVAVMNDAELETLLVDHYVGEAQTLTSGAEQNLLKLAELRGAMTDDEAARWAAIKQAFLHRRMMGGDDEDPVVRVTSQLVRIGEHVGSLSDTIRVASSDSSERQRAWESALVERHSASQEHQAELRAALASASNDSADPAATGEAIGRALAPLLERMEATITALSERSAAVTVTPGEGAAAAADDERIIALASRQADVIEVGMLPILRSLNENLRISHAVWERLGGVTERLQQIAGRSRKPAGTPTKKVAGKKAQERTPPAAPETD